MGQDRETAFERLEAAIGSLLKWVGNDPTPRTASAREVVEAFGAWKVARAAAPMTEERAREVADRFFEQHGDDEAGDANRHLANLLLSAARGGDVRHPDRERLGRIVREVWIAWAKEQPNPKASWLVPWEGLSEPDKEVDRRIGDRLFSEGARGGEGTALPDRQATIAAAIEAGVRALREAGLDGDRDIVSTVVIAALDTVVDAVPGLLTAPAPNDARGGAHTCEGPNCNKPAEGVTCSTEAKA